ncbi:MAG: hypothetical protein ACKO32_10760, partial [Planctomycetia bacterium]
MGAVPNSGSGSAESGTGFACASEDAPCSIGESGAEAFCVSILPCERKKTTPTTANARTTTKVKVMRGDIVLIPFLEDLQRIAASAALFQAISALELYRQCVFSFLYCFHD